VSDILAALNLNGYSSAALIALVCTAFLAGLARGFSGFGAALVFMPLASMVIGPRIAAPLILVMSLFLHTGMIPKAWPQSNQRDAIMLAVGGLVGTPIGAWMLSRTDPLLVRWMIVGLIVPLLALLMSGWRYHGKPKSPLTVGVGVISGFFNGIAQVGGPPVVLYWLGGAIPARTVRANLVIYFAIASCITAVSYAVGGLLTVALIGLLLLVAPTYALGLYIGSHIFGMASERSFRWACYALIAASALVSLPIFDGVLRG
jgi:uncharacterized membrane protein YfcA